MVWDKTIIEWGVAQHVALKKTPDYDFIDVFLWIRVFVRNIGLPSCSGTMIDSGLVYIGLPLCSGTMPTVAWCISAYYDRQWLLVFC